jgi:hypothetical protein
MDGFLWLLPEHDSATGVTPCRHGKQVTPVLPCRAGLC